MNKKNNDTQKVNLILKRFKAALKLKTDKELAKSLKIEANTLSNWKTRGTFDYKLFITFCEENNINIDWLITGEGNSDKSNKGGVKDISEKYGKSKTGIPLIPVEALAGNGGGAVSIKDEDIQDRYVIPDFVDVDFMIRVKGSSMYPKYNSGDIIACKMIQDRSFFQWGRVFVIHHKEQGTMVKRLFPADGEDVECKSDNANYPPFKISLTEITNIALVKGVIRLE